MKQPDTPSQAPARSSSSFQQRKAAISLARLLVYGMEDAKEIGRWDLAEAIGETVERMRREYDLTDEEMCLPAEEKQH